MAASLDARGAELGSIGLMGFGLVLWKLLPGHNAALVLLIALAVWALLSWGLWRASRSRYFKVPVKAN